MSTYDRSEVVRVSGSPLDTDPDENGKMVALKFWDRAAGSPDNRCSVIRLTPDELETLRKQINAFKGAEYDMWDEL
jgi:hypothetical protein